MQANYNPKIIAGATFPISKYPLIMVAWRYWASQKMVTTGKWWLFTEVNIVQFVPNTSIS